MSKKQHYWQIIKDDSNRSFEVIGKSSNDTLLTNNVCEMMKVGMHVQCTTPPYNSNQSEEEITIPGYKLEAGLYNRLINEYEEKTKIRLRTF